MSRPTKLTSHAHDAIVAAAALGEPRRMQAFAANVSPRTLRYWIQQGAKDADVGRGTPCASLYQAIRAAEHGLHRSCMHTVLSAAQDKARSDSVRWAAWILERRFRQDWTGTPDPGLHPEQAAEPHAPRVSTEDIVTLPPAQLVERILAA